MFNEHFRFFYGWLQHLRFFTSVLVWCIVNWCQLCIGCRRSPAWDADLIPQRGSGLRTHPWHRAKGRTCSHWAHTGLTRLSCFAPTVFIGFAHLRVTWLTLHQHESHFLPHFLFGVLAKAWSKHRKVRGLWTSLQFHAVSCFPLSRFALSFWFSYVFLMFPYGFLITSTALVRWTHVVLWAPAKLFLVRTVLCFASFAMDDAAELCELCLAHFRGICKLCIISMWSICDPPVIPSVHCISRFTCAWKGFLGGYLITCYSAKLQAGKNHDISRLLNSCDQPDWRFCQLISRLNLKVKAIRWINCFLFKLWHQLMSFDTTHPMHPMHRRSSSCARTFPAFRSFSSVGALRNGRGDARGPRRLWGRRLRCAPATMSKLSHLSNLCGFVVVHSNLYALLIIINHYYYYCRYISIESLVFIRFY